MLEAHPSKGSSLTPQQLERLSPEDLVGILSQRIPQGLPNMADCILSTLLWDLESLALSPGCSPCGFPCSAQHAELLQTQVSRPCRCKPHACCFLHLLHDRHLSQGAQYGSLSITVMSCRGIDMSVYTVIANDIRHGSFAWVVAPPRLIVTLKTFAPSEHNDLCRHEACHEDLWPLKFECKQGPL